MPEQYILLPKRGLVSDSGLAASMLTSLPIARSTADPQAGVLAGPDGVEWSVTVLDTIRENGPKLVELEDEAAAALNDRRSAVRAVPLVVYRRPDLRLQAVSTAAASSGTTTVTVQVSDASTGNPVPGAHLVAFTDFVQRFGAQGDTDTNGEVQLVLSGPTIERMYCYPPAGYWGAFRTQVPVASTVPIDLTPVDLSYADCVRHFYLNTSFDPTVGVRVGVIDTGVGPHGALNVVGGRNTVTGEPANEFEDGRTHGTHVAGLIGSGGVPPAGLRGMAPHVLLHAYRVFPATGGATNYAILKAMIMAAGDACDIVNLSLGGGPFDDIVEEAIADARNQGMLVVVAAGNDGRQSVSYPAAHVGSTGVSAMGVEGTFPAGSLEEADILRPPGSTRDRMEFIASFSNVGTTIDITGPGVGALSTLPNDEYGPMSGTSMAAPVVAGAAACLLSQDAQIFGMPRNRARSDAIEMLLQSSCSRRGFGATYEGYGLPDPALI